MNNIFNLYDKKSIQLIVLLAGYFCQLRISQSRLEDYDTAALTGSVEAADVKIMCNGSSRDPECGAAEPQAEHSHDLCLEIAFTYSSSQRGFNRCRGLPASAAPRWTVRPYILWGKS